MIDAVPDIGYLQTGIEKEFEVKHYQQGVTLTDRIDYLAPLSNNLCYCLAAEKLLGLEVQEMAQWMRVMLTEFTRLNSHLARRLNLPATQVKALLLGEHGDTMVPIWSSATVAGLPLAQWPGFTPAMEREVFEETKTAGATMIKLKGGSGFAVGVSIREVVESLLLDSRKVLPVSTLQQGLYGIRDICLSVATVVGCGGVGMAAILVRPTL